MKKRQKEEFLDILSEFPSLHREIQTSIETGNSDVAMQLLADCQEYAVNLHQTLIDVEQCATFMTPFFEEYCLILVEMVEKLEHNENSDDGFVLSKFIENLDSICTNA